MKKQIETIAQIPIQQQSWQGLSGAKDSVIFPRRNFHSRINFSSLRMNYIKHRLHLNQF
jgi:hypothetical protein